MVTRWLITGGCGFIGRNLVRSLLAEGGHAIRVVDNLSGGSAGDLAGVCAFEPLDLDAAITPFPDASGKVELAVADILDREVALWLSEGADVIVHLAASTGVAPSVENPRMDCVTNVIGTLNFLEAARAHRVRRFVFASSGAPVGEVDPPIHEEMAPRPVSPYGAGKLAGEGYCSAYFRSFGVETVCLRFGNVYGPYSGKKESVVARFIKRAFDGEPLEIYGDGSQTRDFIYIDDLIRAIRQSERVPGIGGEVFQVATSRETSVGELAEALLPILRDDGGVEVRVETRGPRVGDVMRNYSDTAKARALLGWQAETALGDGLRTTVAWFLNTAPGEWTGQGRTDRDSLR